MTEFTAEFIEEQRKIIRNGTMTALQMKGNNEIDLHINRMYRRAKQEHCEKYYPEALDHIEHLQAKTKRLKHYLEEAAHAAACGKNPADYLAREVPTELRDEIERLQQRIAELEQDLSDQSQKRLENALASTDRIIALEGKIRELEHYKRLNEERVYEKVDGLTTFEEIEKMVMIADRINKSNSVTLAQLNNMNKNLQQILENTKKKQPANLDTLIFDGGSTKCKMISVDQLEDVLEEVVVFCYGVNPEKWDFAGNGEPDYIIYMDGDNNAA